jgi:ABC-2 type transport system ATP-binding protein
MYGQSSSAQQGLEVGSASNRRLSLIGTNRDEKKMALRVMDLTKSYGAIQALTGVSFDVHEGEVLGLLGLNGAGKTTLISMLATERRPSAGDALLMGHSIRNEQRAVRQLIGVAPQEIALYPMLTAAENLRFFGRIYGIPRLELTSRIEQLLQFVGLQERGSDPVETFSIGMKRRLNLATALVHRPKLILLDEPTAGVDPESREAILELVRRLRDDGNAVLYTTHYMDEAQELCDRLCILSEGRLVSIGTFDDLLHRFDYSEVIELSGLPARTNLFNLGALRGFSHVERRDGAMRLFVNRAADFLEPIQKIMSRNKSVRLKISPISLEGLFLRLASKETRQLDEHYQSSRSGCAHEGRAVRFQLGNS